jgi:hypothetical protein
MARNTGKRPHEKLLEIMNVGTRLTPVEIDAHVGNGNYASKHVWFLGKLGFGFDVERQGRTVIAYTMTAEPANASDIRNPAVKAPKAKVAKAPKAKVAKAPAVARVKAAAVKVAKNKKAKSADDEAERMLQELNMNNACEVGGGSYSIDSDWDSMDGIDVANFLK